VLFLLSPAKVNGSKPNLAGKNYQIQKGNPQENFWGCSVPACGEAVHFLCAYVCYSMRFGGKQPILVRHPNGVQQTAQNFWFRIFIFSILSKHKKIFIIFQIRQKMVDIGWMDGGWAICCDATIREKCHQVDCNWQIRHTVDSAATCSSNLAVFRMF